MGGTFAMFVCAACENGCMASARDSLLWSKAWLPSANVVGCETADPIRRMCQAGVMMQLAFEPAYPASKTTKYKALSESVCGTLSTYFEERGTFWHLSWTGWG